MTTACQQTPDAMLRRMAALARTRADRAADTAERIAWLTLATDLTRQAAEAAAIGGDD